ncbi:MAG: penicillin acylase family protein [Acetobacteraceae bacterium]
MRTFLRGLKKLLAAIGIAVLLVPIAIGAALWFTLPHGDIRARIPQLSGPVDVTFDQDGIPRIRATTELDAVAMLGYVHARDRMFQMDLMRRAASGRLSEIAGPATLPIDRLMRTLGLKRHAVEDYATLPADTKALLEAYAAGVNARIAARGRFIAPEFLLLGAPAPWQPSDSLLWGKTMGMWLSANWRTELARLALAGHLPPALIDQLWPPKSDPGHPEAALAPGTRFGAADRAGAATLLAALPHFPAPYTMPPTASNEWAVDGRFTKSGAPLLAGDPHLAYGFPGIWFLARIDLPDRTLVGATGPGVPGVVIGHNGHIAWTFTTTGADVQDVFIETPVGADSYATPDGPRPFLRRTETIKVRGQPDETLVVRETRHGPVISDIQPAPDGAVLAVAMANLQPGDLAAAGLTALNRARSVAEAGQAAAMITSPIQNLLVADRQTIGLFVTGRVPLRKAGNGSFPVDGADGVHDWVGWASGDALPHIVAPASGRLVNANERIAPPDFPVFLGRDWFGDWRARRIREMLDATPKHDAAGFARMQADVNSVFARQILPVLTAVPVTGRASRLQVLLRGWDGGMEMDRPQPLIFNAWTAEFYRRVLGRAGVPVEHGGPLIDFVGYVLSPAGAHWCGGDCNTLLADSLAAADAVLTERFGSDASAWRWGDAHVALFQHPLLRGLPLLGKLATISIPSPGDDSTVNRGVPNGRLQDVQGAGFRGVYDLADLQASLFMVTPGQSGNLFSRHARDFLTRWRDGATITIGPTPATIRARIRATP